MLIIALKIFIAAGSAVLFYFSLKSAMFLLGIIGLIIKLM